MIYVQRAKDKSTLDGLANQIIATTGSIRFIEEQLNSRHQGMDAVKEGQVID